MILLLWLLSFQDPSWETELYQAALDCDLASDEAGSSQGSAAHLAIRQLQGRLAHLLVPQEDRLSEQNRVVAQVLARYWAEYFHQQGKELAPFQVPTFDFYFEAQTDARAQCVLGARGRIFEPARPFANGSLLTFSVRQLWFVGSDGVIQNHALPFARPQETSLFWLETNDASDSYVLGFLANRLGLEHVLVGKPHSLNGQFQADSLKELFDQILERDGYSFAKTPGKKLFIFRPGFKDVDIEKALAQVSITDPMGLTAIVPTAAELTPTTLEELMFRTPREPLLLNNYGIRLELDGIETSMLLSDTEQVIKGLVQLSLKKHPEPEAKTLAGLLERFMGEVLGQDQAARQMLLANLHHGLSTWSSPSAQEQARAKALAEVLSQDWRQ